MPFKAYYLSLHSPKIDDFGDYLFLIIHGINSELPLRHELQEDKAVGDLLEVLGWEKRHKRVKSVER